MPIKSFSYFNSKSISRLILLGSIEIVFLSSLNFILLFIFIIFIGALLISIPALVIASTNNFAEPSKIGTSSLSNSTNTLSIPSPYSAPIRCSIVEILTPLSLDTVVQKTALLTLKRFGTTMLSFLRSTLLKIIPVFGSAGLITKPTFLPLCRPTPLNLI